MAASERDAPRVGRPNAELIGELGKSGLFLPLPPARPSFSREIAYEPAFGDDSADLDG